MNCPMTGKPCPHNKVFTISETINEFTHTTKCCRHCAPDYVNLRNNASNQHPVQQVDISTILSKMIGSSPANLDGYPLIVHKVLGFLPEHASEVTQNLSGTGQKAHQAKTCPGCNSTLNDIRKAKRMGCKQCYETFAEELDAYLPKIQGNKVQHKGKVISEKPAFKNLNASNEKLISVLQEQMQQAISDENYEKAAQYRDLIQKYGGSVEN